MNVQESLALAGVAVGGVIALCAAALKAVARGEELRAIAQAHGAKLKKVFAAWQEKMAEGKTGRAAWMEVMLWRDPAEIEAAKKAGKHWKTVRPVYEQLPDELKASVLAVIQDKMPKPKKKETQAARDEKVMGHYRKTAGGKDFVRSATAKTIKRKPSKLDLDIEGQVRQRQRAYSE